jgi:pseudouridine synthase
MRINKLLSHVGIASRRAADGLIQQGRVEVNRQVVVELGTKVDPDNDDIRVDGRRIKPPATRRYILLYKPRGVMSTRSDPQKRTTVVDLLARGGAVGYFYPVGRLDYDSEGLIVLTNDGDFAEHVTHPRYELERTYEAHLAGVPDERDLERLRRGVTIDGRKTLPATVRLVHVVERRRGPEAILQITLREGRNRQVRHMCDAIAHPVERLRRTGIGAISDRQLRPGQFRDLTDAEVRQLTSAPAKPHVRPKVHASAKPDASAKFHASAKPRRSAKPPTSAEPRVPGPPRPPGPGRSSGPARSSGPPRPSGRLRPSARSRPAGGRK